MLVFDRLSTFPLTLVLLSNSPLYSLFIHFDTSCILLSSLFLSLAEYARYSRLLYFPFSLCLIGRCSRRWSPGEGVPRRRLLRRRVPRRPGVAWSSQAGGLAFRSVPLMIFVLAFLRQNLTNYVCTQILCSPFDPHDPWLVISDLYLICV